MLALCYESGRLVEISVKRMFSKTTVELTSHNKYVKNNVWRYASKPFYGVIRNSRMWDEVETQLLNDMGFGEDKNGIDKRCKRYSLISICFFNKRNGAERNGK